MRNFHRSYGGFPCRVRIAGITSLDLVEWQAHQRKESGVHHACFARFTVLALRPWVGPGCRLHAASEDCRPCVHAWSDRSQGTWPESIPQHQRNEYNLQSLRHWLEVFIVRFFQTSQFKRSALPNGPTIGSGGALSPRSDWRAPSDATATVWLQELARRWPAQG